MEAYKEDKQGDREVLDMLKLIGRPMRTGVGERGAPMTVCLFCFLQFRYREKWNKIDNYLRQQREGVVRAILIAKDGCFEEGKIGQ